MCPEREIYNAQPGGNCEKRNRLLSTLVCAEYREVQDREMRNCLNTSDSCSKANVQINYHGMFQEKTLLRSVRWLPCWYLTTRQTWNWEINSLALPPVQQGRSGQMTIPRSARLPLSIGHLLESECPYHGKSQKNTPRISLMTVIMTTMLAPNPKPQYRLDLGSSIPVRS